MPKKTWTVLIEGQQHTIEIDVHTLTGAMELMVDGKVVKALEDIASKMGMSGITREGRLVRRMAVQDALSKRNVIEFEVAGKPAILRRKTFGGYELFVDGRKIS